MFQRFVLTIAIAGIFAHGIPCKGENLQDMNKYLRDSLPGQWQCPWNQTGGGNGSTIRHSIH